ncbi:hypothetical protein [Komagataeibacter diospyri]|uniref:Uncharacterized protein n=1 Tax=Komagataeibacter diospyri TaxID=1932662 RepID=A0A4P5P4V6_9PROT|nr:hypothetical protein [Komagataeibacter diospyri]GCE85166.1 hypothetical protein MSKU9_3307 [Komagataeibacter diospyri]
MADKAGWKKGAGWCLLGTVGVLFLYNLGAHQDGNHPASAPAAVPSASNDIMSQTPLDPVLSGRVLPFKIVQAVRNYSFKDGPQAQISVMVDGGEKADWAATGASIARVAMRDGVTSATVRVVRDNPWVDMPPTEYKSLADVYVDPNIKDGKSNSGFDVVLANEMAPVSLIEYDELDNELSTSTPTSASDTERDKKSQSDADRARRYVIKKYKLPAKWSIPEINPYGTTGDAIDGNRIAAVAIDDDQDLARIQQCMTSDDGTPILKGCLADRDNLPYILPSSERRPPINYRASNLLMSDMETSDPCQAFVRFIETHRATGKDDQRRNALFMAAIIVSAKISPTLKTDQYEELMGGLMLTCSSNPHMKISDAARDAAERLGLPLQ